MKRRFSAICCVILAVCLVFGTNQAAYANGLRTQEDTAECEEGSQRALVSPGNGSGQQNIVKNDLNLSLIHI